MSVRSPAASKKIVPSVDDWQQIIQRIDLNTVHKQRKCEISIIVENDPKALTYIHQLRANNITDDTIIVIDIEELHDYFNFIMFKMPGYIDPATSKLFHDILTKIPVLDLENRMDSSTSLRVLMVKLRILAALKEHLFKYEEPIRRQEMLLDEYKLLIDVPQDAGGATSKKKGSKTKKQQKSKSKSSKSDKSSKKGKKKGGGKDVKDVNVEEPCLMLENNVRKPILQPRWNNVTLEPRTLQILLAHCYNFEYLYLLSDINLPIKCLIEVSLPSITYPNILFHTATSLRCHISNISFTSNDDKSIFASHNMFVPSGDNTLLNPSNRAAQIDVFWKKFEYTIQTAPIPNYINNIYYLKYVPIDMPIEEHLSFYEDQCLVTYDEIKYLLESTDIIKRMHQNYNGSIKQYSTVVQSEKPHKAFCYKKYSETLDCLPPDVCTVPIILDALLNEVEVQLASNPNVKDESLTKDDLSGKKSSSDVLQQRPKYYATRHFLATLLQHYRMYSVVDKFIPIANSIDNVLLNLKIDRNQIRMHDNNKMAERFHSYLNIRVPLENTFLDIIKRQPLCNILKKSFVSEYVKNGNEMNNLSSRLQLDIDKVVIFLGVVIFNLINWSTYKRNLRDRAKIECNDDLNKFIQIMTGRKANELKHCDSVMDSESCRNINKNLDILFYEKLSKLEMLQELNNNCHWYDSIKYYYCSLIDSILVEFDNNLNDFGISDLDWICHIRTMPNLASFSKNVFYNEMQWLLLEEMKYQKALEAKRKMSIKTELELKAIHQSFHGIKVQEVSYILKNTLKDVLMNLDLPEIGDEGVQIKQKVKKPDKLIKTPPVKARKSIDSVHSRCSAKSTKGSAILQQEPTTPKVFFADIGFTCHTTIRGSTTRFVSKDGIKIIYDKRDNDIYNSLNIDMNGDNFILHVTKDENFKFHFYLQNDIIINFVKPANKSVVDCIKTDKLYTVFRNYSYRLNNFQRIVKKQSTYLLSDDVLERIRTNMQTKSISKSRLRNATSLASTTTAVYHTAKERDNEKESSEELEMIGDLRVHELKTREDALETLKQAEASQQPIFKICSSKLHQFNYITRKKSHANINYKDAVEDIINAPDPPIKHRYLIRELVGSIDNDDVTSDMPYNYTVTMPTSLTVRSEVDIQGKQQIKQFYIDKGPQLRDIYNEVSRTFTHNGEMIVKMSDGQVKILSLNGNVIQFEIPLFDRRNESKSKKKVKHHAEYIRALRRLTKCHHKHTLQRICVNSSRKQARHKHYEYISPKSLLITKNFRFPYPMYSILRIDGGKISFRDGKYIHARNHFPYLEEDFICGTWKYSTPDGTSIELRRNGDMITTFSDKTVLISSYEIDEKPVFVEIENIVLNEEYTVDYTEELIRCSDWVLIHSSREFRHPKYATVRVGGSSNTTDIILPCDISLHNTGNDFKLKINPNVEAVFNTSKIELNTNFCSSCKSGTNTIVNIENLYMNDVYAQTDISTAFVMFRDSFKRCFQLLFNGEYTYNKDFEPGLNMYQCTAHRTFNEKKIYILKQNLSGVRLWPKQSYINRFLQSLNGSESVPNVQVQQADDVYFLLKNFVLLFNKYLMEPATSETYHETYRFLQKMPYNKHTNLLLRESEHMILSTPSPIVEKLAGHPRLTDKSPPSELELARISTTTLFETDKLQFASLPQITIQDCANERYERIKKICQLKRDREAVQRAKAKEPINYFLYKEAQETEERLRKQMIYECPTSSNLKLTFKALQLTSCSTNVISTKEEVKSNGSSIHTIFCGSDRNLKSEVFAVKSYISTKRYPSFNNAYARTHSSANLIKQHSALNLAELSTLIHVYHLNKLSDPLIRKKHKDSHNITDK